MPPAGQTEVLESVGVVVIGHNEDKQLCTCLLSVAVCTGIMVYVDSGSTDHSLQMASDLGVVSIELDMSRPFSAERARNKGF